MLIIIRIKRIFWLFSDMCRTITSRNKCWKYHPIFFHLPFSPTLDVLYQTSLFFAHLTCFHFFSSCSIVHTLLHTLPQPNFQGWPVFSTPRPPSPVYSPLCTFKSLFPVFFPVLLPTSPTPKDLCVMWPQILLQFRIIYLLPFKFHSEHKKWRGTPLSIFRLLISLSMLLGNRTEKVEKQYSFL